MRTQTIQLLKLKAGLLIIMTFICLVFSACEKYPQYDKTIDNNPNTEIFTIGPEGTTITAHNNEVFIRIPEGAVVVPTELKINYKKGVKYESYILMEKSYSISIVNQQLLKPITLRLSYSPGELCLGSNDEHCLQIYAYRNNNGTIHKSDLFSPVGDCCVDTNNETIEACFEELGNFVVGIKH